MIVVVVIPVPARDSTEGLLLALLTIVIEPLRAPRTVGVKETLNVQLCPGVIPAPEGQLLFCVKSPVIVILLMVNDPGPLLVNVKLIDVLVVPRS